MIYNKYIDNGFQKNLISPFSTLVALIYNRITNLINLIKKI